MTESGRRWVADAVDSQLGGASHQERRWGAGEKERTSATNGYIWGGGRKEEGKERSGKW